MAVDPSAIQVELASGKRGNLQRGTRPPLLAGRAKVAIAVPAPRAKKEAASPLVRITGCEWDWLNSQPPHSTRGYDYPRCRMYLHRRGIKVRIAGRRNRGQDQSRAPPLGRRTHRVLAAALQAPRTAL